MVDKINFDNLTWLWLEDSLSDIHLYKNKITGAGLKCNIINNPEDLTEFLIENKDKLNKYGLILDILISKAKIFSNPIEWNGERNETVSTESGYLAGMNYCDKIILVLKEDGEPVWNPIPPIIFFSHLNKEEDSNIMAQYKTIENKIKNIMKNSNSYFPQLKEEIHKNKNDINLKKKLENEIEKNIMLEYIHKRGVTSSAFKTIVDNWKSR